MDNVAFPLAIDPARVHAGPGSDSLLAASVASSDLAGELHPAEYLLTEQRHAFTQVDGLRWGRSVLSCL